MLHHSMRQIVFTESIRLILPKGKVILGSTRNVLETWMIYRLRWYCTALDRQSNRKWNANTIASQRHLFTLTITKVANTKCWHVFEVQSDRMRQECKGYISYGSQLQNNIGSLRRWLAVRRVSIFMLCYVFGNDVMRMCSIARHNLGGLWAPPILPRRRRVHLALCPIFQVLARGARCSA